MKKIKSNNFEIYSFLENKENTPLKIIDDIVNNIPEIKEIGFAGLKNKEFLVNTIDRLSLDKDKNHQEFKINEKIEKKILKISQESLGNLEIYSKSKKYIFLFPCFDNFIIEKMNGVSGFCPWKNVILISINTRGKNWQQELKDIISHEFAHSVSEYPGKISSLGECIIYEGLAEHFMESVNKQSSRYSKLLNEKDVKKYLELLSEKLNEKDFNLYQEVFFGSKKYPVWTGYCIGYYLVKKYLEKYETVNWNNLLRLDVNKILSEEFYKK